MMIVFWLFVTMPLFGNNLKITEVVTVDNVNSTAADVHLNITWENSWRNNENWDAAWVFLKYCQNGEWKHVNLSETGHSTNNNGVISIGKTDDKGVGVFVYRNDFGNGPNNFDLTLRWDFTKNDLTQIEIANIMVDAFGVEMVFVPEGAYDVGDNISSNSFRAVSQMNSEYDIIGPNDGFGYDLRYASNSCYIDKDLLEIHDRDKMLGGYYTNIQTFSSYEWYLTVDFKSAKKIYWVGVSLYSNSGLCGYEVLGSVDGGNYTSLFSTTSTQYYDVVTTSYYPVSNILRIPAEKLGLYRFYKLKFIFRPNYKSLNIQGVSMSDIDDIGMLPYVNISSEDEIPYVDGVFTDLSSGVGTGLALPVSFPKGYQGFYCMKYEVSQDQYVGFLNSLNFDQQKGILGVSITSKEGSVLMGTDRNGIRVFSPGVGAPENKAALVALDLDGDKIYNENHDGACLACNYLSVPKAYAYADWAGLRPMTELEYEKSARGPEEPIVGYAWGNNDLMGDGDFSLNDSGTDDESPSEDSNWNNKIIGPMRVGAFANSLSDRESSGASYYGILDLSGNLAEICVPVNKSTINFTGEHGDGMIDNNGADVANWPSTPIAHKGGSFKSSQAQLHISDRSSCKVITVYGSYNYVGFRAVRTAP